jgi:hypothetical protein
MIDDLLVIPALRDLSRDDLRAAIERGDVEVVLGIVVPRLAGGSIVASDLVFYNSAAMTTDSTTTTGGAIDTLRRPDFTQMAASDTVRIVSTAAGDTTQTVTITGRLADGSLASEVLALNGMTVVTSVNTYERLLKAEMSATAVGTVTVARTTGPTTIRVIPIGERGFQAMFQQLASNPSAITNWYEKIFVKNTNGTLALTSATILINADPQAVFKFGLPSTLDDTATTTDRTTAPAGITFNTSTKNVANSGSLSSGSRQGIWMNLTLAAGNAALKSTVTMEIDGQTT